LQILGSPRINTETGDLGVELRTPRCLRFQEREWFTWCERKALDPLVGIKRAHVELYIRALGDHGLMDFSVVTIKHAVCGFFRFTHIDASSAATPPSMPGCRTSTAISPAPTAWTGSS
jgi:hypothetical protein